MAPYRGFIPGYNGSPPVTPYRPPAQTEAERLASIAAIGERNRRLQEQRAELERDAQQILLQTRTNAAWNELTAKTAAKNKPQNVRVTTKEGDDTTTRYLTPAQAAAEKAAKNAPKIAELLAKKADMVKNIEAGDKHYGLFNMWSRPNRVAELDSKLAALQPPPDLLSGPSDLVSPPVVAPPVVAPAVQPTPMGIIGTPQRNSFIAESTPLGMNREQANEWAIGANTPATEAYAPPRDLLRSPSFPSGYQPEHGAFQMDPNTPSRVVVGDAPMAPFTPEARDLAPAAPTIPKSHIAHLLANPDLAPDFDQKYGEGASDAYLREQP